jgi:hypothetical protein
MGEAMRVLIGCEESQVVCKAFRDKGHEAYSCDLVDTRGNPEWHIKGDIMDNLEEWDLMILHPDCTAMANSGNAWYGKKMPKHQKRIDALKWTLNLWNRAIENCDKVAMENPISVLWNVVKRSQYINPYQFGHMEQKKTGLALHGLPNLVETDNVYDEMMKLSRKEREKTHFMSPGPNRKRDRSVTYQGIADALATQYGDL